MPPVSHSATGPDSTLPAASHAAVHVVVMGVAGCGAWASGAGHFYPPSLVDSQFAALQDPSGEAGVLVLAGDAPLQQLALSAVAWLKAGEP